jgi:hypothetical protein
MSRGGVRAGAGRPLKITRDQRDRAGALCEALAGARAHRLEVVRVALRELLGVWVSPSTIDLCWKERRRDPIDRKVSPHARRVSWG